MEKKQNKLVLAIIVIAVIMNLVTIVTIIPFQYFSVAGLILSAITSIEHLAVVYYVLYGYRKPHGNLLRYTMLLFAITLGTALVLYGKEYSMLNFALPVAEILLIPYIAGRLNKVEQNKVLVPFVLILFIIDAISFCFTFESQSFIYYYLTFGQAIEWFAISAAYFVRYKEHKEAGLTDK